MPIDYEIDAVRRRAVIRGVGPVEHGATARAVDEVLADPLFQSGYDLLVDLTKVDAAPVDADHARVAAQQSRESFRELALALRWLAREQR